MTRRQKKKKKYLPHRHCFPPSIQPAIIYRNMASRWMQARRSLHKDTDFIRFYIDAW